MKKQHLLPFLSVLLLAVVFASCSTSVDIAKRQYGSGYYVHVSKKNHNTEPAAVASVNTKEEAPAVVNEVKDQTPAAQTEVAVPAKEEVAKPAGKIVAPIKHRAYEAVKQVKETVENTIEPVSEERGSQFRSEERSSGRSLSRGDAPAIVLIILCLILPFIAVGIVDDWGTRFLISILLTLLFFLPGVIYAFIVCFG